jgi:tetratricopeptide (TPR) repeat protein
MKNKRLFPILLSAALAVGSAVYLNSTVFYREAYKPYPFKETKSIPSYALLFSASGFRASVADFLWMDIVQYIGDKENAKTRYKDLYKKITDLSNVDPNFTYVYCSASGIYFFELNEPDRAIELIRKGIENNPKYWVLNLYLAAYTYRRKWDTSGDLSDFKNAVRNVETAVKEEGHPPMLERILGSLYLKLAEIDPKNKKTWLRKSVLLWLDMYEHPTEEPNKEYATQKLKDFGLLK